MKVLIIGHISYDFRDGKFLLGGPPSYMIPVFMKLDTEVHVITSTHEPSKLPKYKNCKYFIVPSTKTTTFEFKIPQNDSQLYPKDDRQLILVNKAENITADFIKNNADSVYDIVIISPIINEVDQLAMETAVKLSNKCFLDMQGLVRIVQNDGIITHSFHQPDMNWALKTFDVIKISNSEFPDRDQFLNPFHSLLIITKSGNGYELHSNSTIEHILSTPENDVIDATGSGDIFLAAFSYFFSSKSTQDAIRIADSYARLNLKNLGIPPVSLFRSI